MALFASTVSGAHDPARPGLLPPGSPWFSPTTSEIPGDKAFRRCAAVSRTHRGGQEGDKEQLLLSRWWAPEMDLV